jgi:hypothetical protein
MLAERGAIIAQRFRKTVSRTSRPQDAYYTDWAKWNSEREEYFVSGLLLPVGEAGGQQQKPEAALTARS